MSGTVNLGSTQLLLYIKSELRRIGNPRGENKVRASAEGGNQLRAIAVEGVLPKKERPRNRILSRMPLAESCYEFIFVWGVTNRRQNALLSHEVVAMCDGDPNRPSSRAGDVLCV